MKKRILSFAFEGVGKDVWDRDYVHNPAVLKHNGIYPNGGRNVSR